MRKSVIEIESPAVCDRTANDQLPTVECGVAGIDPGFQTCVLKSKERIAAENRDAGSVGAPDPVHFIQPIEIACGICSIRRKEVVRRRTTRYKSIGRLRKDIFEVRNRRKNRRIRPHLRRSDATFIVTAQDAARLCPIGAGCFILEVRQHLHEILLQESLSSQTPDVTGLHGDSLGDGACVAHVENNRVWSSEVRGHSDSVPKTTNDGRRSKWESSLRRRGQRRQAPSGIAESIGEIGVQRLRYQGRQAR